MAAEHRAFRHGRVWLKPRALQLGSVGGTGGMLAAQRLLDWIVLGRPVIARSAIAGDKLGSDRIAIGLALVEDGVRSRWAYTVPLASVSRIEQPLLLAEAVHVLPEEMQIAAALIASQGNAIGLPVHVFGSSFWQHASAASYLHPGSDLDLFVRPTTLHQARAWLQALHDVQITTPVRLDGEIAMPDGGAVAWRELAGTSRQVLVKSLDGPRLVTMAEAWAAWPAAREAA